MSFVTSSGKFPRKTVLSFESIVAVKQKLEK